MPLNFLNNGYFAGTVGIGTNSPNGKLEITSNSSLSSYITQYTNDADGAELVIRTARGTQASPVRYNTNDSAGRLLFQAYASSGGFKDAASIESILESCCANSYAGLRFNYMPTTTPHSLKEGIRLNASGNVGIGSDSPSGRLEIKDNDGATSVYIKNDDSTLTNANDVQSRIIMKGNYWSGNSSDIVETRINSVHTDSDGNGGSALTFMTQTGGDAPLEHLRINKVGNLGVGTINPIASLQVGTITATAMSQVVGKARIVGTNYIPSSTQMGTLDIASTTRNSSSPWNQGFGPSLTFSQSISGYVNGYEVVLGAIKTISTQVGNTGQEGAMTFLVNGGASTGVVERMRIAEDGNVGIGTTSPIGNFNISGGTGDAVANDVIQTFSKTTSTGNVTAAKIKLDHYNTNHSDLQFLVKTTASSAENDAYYTNALTILGRNANVGIGTTNPAQNFVVADATLGNGIELVPGATATIQAYNRGTSAYANLNIDTLEARVRSVGATVFSNGASFATSESMRITSAGNVGINATIPSEKLDVDGNVRVRNLTAGIVTSSATGVLSTGGPTPMNMSLGEGYAGNIREKYYRTNKTVYPSAIGSQYAQLIQQGIFNSMSLIMSPIATETAVVSSPAPNDGSGDFSFNRNSPGSRVGSDGYIVRETQNLFIQSNDMSASSAWTLSAATLTGGQTGYTGAPNAWRLNDNATNTGHIIRQTPGYGGTVTVSIYAKAGTKDYLYIRGVTQGASNQYTYFKLTDGTLGTVQGITAFMEAAGGGWYRCSVTYDHNPAYEYYFGMTNTDNDPTYAGDGTGNIYFMNPQLENGMGAREYIPTTTVVKYAGVTTNVPRIDYLNNIPELLIEPNSTNVVYDGSHMAGLTAITESFSLSPEGIINGIKINETATTGQHYGHVNCSVVSGTQYFLSVYMKKGTSSFSDIHTQSNTISTSARINFDNVTITVSGGTEGFIYDVGGGWYRVGYKTTAATQTAASMDIYLTISSLGSYAGNVDNYTEYYGVQLETSSILTSLIPTYAGAVTRGQEQINLANMAANNIAGNATSGTLMMEFSNHYNGIAGDSLRFHQSSTIIGRGYLYVRNMGFADSWGGAGLSLTDNVLSKGIWRLNSLTDGSFFLNGVKGNNVSGTAWGNIDKIVIYGNYGTMRIRNIFFAPLALTDTQCVTLTTINE